MNFYVLKPQGGLFGTKWAYGTVVVPREYGDVGQRCPVCRQTHGHLVWLPPHRIHLSSAKPEKWGDFLWGAGFDLIVSARFKAIYQTEGLTGIRHFDPPVEIVRMGRRKTGDLRPDLPSYHLVHIERLGPELDEEASGMIRLEGWERIVIKPESWSGEDIFYPQGISGTVVVSERFKDVVEANQLENVWLIPAEKWAYGREQPGYAPRSYVRED